MKFWLPWRKRERELEDEIQGHLRMAAEDRVERGTSAREAEAAARREFGNVGMVKETTRDVWGWRWLEDLVDDIRFGLRTLSKNPAFTAVAILALALGIGANTAIFSLIDVALLRSLPVHDAHELVLLEWHARKSPAYHSYSTYGDCGTVGNGRGCTFSRPFFHEVRSQSGVFSSMAAFESAGRLDLGGNGPASVIDRVEYISGEYFQTLGVKPAAGRLINVADDAPSAPPVLVLSDSYWRSQFAGSGSAIGKTVYLNKVACTIVGVAEPRFDALSPGRPIQMWVPLSVQPQLEQAWDNREADPKNWYLVLVGRLKPEMARGQAQAVVSTLFHNEMTSGTKPMSKPEDQPGISLTPAKDGLTGDRAQIATPFYVLMFAVAVVLLIACANVAGLLLARAAARSKEMALRFALGASSGRILRQLLTESVMLSLAGGLLGVLLASWVVASIMAFVAANQEGQLPFVPAINAPVLLFTLAVSILTGILFGLAPAFRGMRVDLMPMLKEGSGSTTQKVRSGRAWFTAGNGLVIAQITLSIVVLASAGLLVRTLQNLKNVDPGFDTRNVLTFGIDPTLLGFAPAAADNFYRELQGRLSLLPGVVSASYSWQPLLGGSLWTTSFHLPGKPKDEESKSDILAIGPNFLETMGIPLLAGRTFGPEDFDAAQVAAAAREAQNAQAAAKLKPGAKLASPLSLASLPPLPVIVNQAFVRSYFPKQNVLGQRFGQTEADPEKDILKDPGWEIIGVVADAKYNSLRRKIQPTGYVPDSGGGVSFVLRTSTEPGKFIPQIRSLVGQMDSNLPVYEIKTETQQIDSQIFAERLIARLSGLFGALALILACVGLYGLVSFEVGRRTREIGIRAALGADKRNVLRMVLMQGMRLSLIGSIIGIALALGVTRFAKSLLFGVGAADPLTFLIVTVLLIGVTLAACYFPARRAMLVDPVVALRYE